MMRKCTSDKDLDGMMKLVNCVTTSNLAHNLQYYVRKGLISLEMPSADPLDLQWDGELLVRFDFEKLGLKNLVNHIIALGRADEIDILDNNTLRLWWD